ncbi:MAG: 3'(2'),5'-bisphosphate nucleotidase CysQ [Pelagibacterales bacterium]|nr:3'(2'),5'-bisphosphate nucleotidase CysQ [Pelagibacterales bacterium]
MSYFNEAQIEKIVEIAFEAGEIAVRAQNSGDFKVMTKPDNSKVTSADIEVSKFIHQKLTNNFPEIEVVCEEGNLREVNDIFWLVDPIDGTSSFIQGSSEFALNIALIKDKKVVFGLIYAPLFENGKIAFSDSNNNLVLQDRHKKTYTSFFDHSESKKILKIITSARTKDCDIEKYLNQFYPDYINNFAVERLSSAVKFFRIIEGKADLYLHFRPSMEWDIASGQFLVELMGGKVKKLSFNENGFEIGEEMLYKKIDFINKSFVSFIGDF